MKFIHMTKLCIKLSNRNTGISQESFFLGDYARTKRHRHPVRDTVPVPGQASTARSGTIRATGHTARHDICREKLMTKLAQLLCGLTLAVLWLPAGRAEDVDSGDIAIKFGANGSTDSVDLNITGTDVTWGSLFYPGNGKSINITGNGYAINATADGAFIYEDAESYTFAASDLIFNNTTSTRRTYSLLHLTGVNASATLNFDEVTFQNFHNTDGEGSGAVINIHGGANATVNVGPGGLVFLNNDGTLSSGGAVGLLSNNSTLTFNGPGLVSFLDNSTDYYGGAISQSYNSSLTFASDVLFEGNHAQSFGGAIDIWGYSGTTLFSGSSVFRNNYVYTSAS